MSGGSSMYGSTTEEQRQANEVRRLKRELHDARDQVMSLSSQLSTNVSTKTYLSPFVSFSSKTKSRIDLICFCFFCYCHVFQRN